MTENHETLLLYIDGVPDEKNNEESVDMDEENKEKVAPAAEMMEGSVEPNFSEEWTERAK